MMKTQMDPFTISNKYHIPFTGSIVNEYELFQFLLYQPLENGITIILPDWAYMQSQLKEWDMINFHFALQVDSLFVTKGRIDEIVKDPEMKGHRCKVTFLQKITNPFNPSIKFNDQEWVVDLAEKTPEEIIVQAIKNCFLIKRGIEVYLDHLVAYFARITDTSPAHYDLVKEYVFDDIKQRVLLNKKQLKFLYFQLRNEKDHKLMFQLLDPVRLMKLLEPELNFDLLNLMFDNRYHLPASEALKQLEDFIYWNYNNIIMLLVIALKNKN